MKLNEDKILIDPISDTLIGGIVVPGIGNMKYRLCRIVECGPGRYNPYADKVIDHGFRKGDRVFVNQGVIAELPLKKAGVRTKYAVVPSSECIGPLDDDESV